MPHSSTISVSTLNHARRFLESIIDRGELFDFEDTNNISLRAQRAGQDTLNQVQKRRVLIVIVR